MKNTILQFNVSFLIPRKAILTCYYKNMTEMLRMMEVPEAKCFFVSFDTWRSLEAISSASEQKQTKRKYFLSWSCQKTKYAMEGNRQQREQGNSSDGGLSKRKKSCYLEVTSEAKTCETHVCGSKTLGPDDKGVGKICL